MLRGVLRVTGESQLRNVYLLERLAIRVRSGCKIFTKVSNCGKNIQIRRFL